MMKRFKKAIKIIAIIVVIVFLGFPVTLFYVDYFPYMYENIPGKKTVKTPIWLNSNLLFTIF